MKRGFWIVSLLLQLFSYVQAHDRGDFGLLSRSHLPPHLRSEILAEEAPEVILDAPILRNLNEMDRLNLKKVVLETQPWSDSYWPTSKGQIAARYADSAATSSHNWASNYSYFLSRPSTALVVTGAIEHLSPSEKYDLLVGDSSWTLTQYSWSEGQRVNKTFGFVPAWTGLCHGWAAAAISYDTPQKSVYLPAADGRTMIRFYPSDIKGLATAIWANENDRGKTRLAGDVCRPIRPELDTLGRPTDSKCHNINPGTWHIGVVTQLGVAKRSLVMDATWNLQIWNHPVYSYEYRYFNPQTLEAVQRLAQAKVPVSRFTKDKYKKYRALGTHSVVGVMMDVTYMAEIKASHSERQSNITKTARYMYDLELDSAGNIIGGEWYSNFHPDFIWTVPESVRADSIGDRMISANEWTGQGPIPDSWKAAARESSRRGQPLGAVVEMLVRLSQASELP